MLRKSWLDDTYESDLPAEISPDVFYGHDREPIIVPKSRGGFESLGGKVPSHENFGIDDVVKLVGKDYMVDVIGKSQVACPLVQYAHLSSFQRCCNASFVKMVARPMGILLQNRYTPNGRFQKLLKS